MARENKDRSVPALDMNHGFVQSIIKNQIDRDEYDKDQKLLKQKIEVQSFKDEVKVKEERKRRERRTPLHQVYVPPHMRKASTNTEQSSSTSPTKESSEPELLLRFEFEGNDGKMSYLDITKKDDLKKSVRHFAAANGIDSRLRDALYHKLYLELRDT